MAVSPASPADVFDAACPSRRALELISGKWVPLVLPALARGPLRNSELLRKLDGISQKMMTQTLRDLEPVSYTHLDVYKRQVRAAELAALYSNVRAALSPCLLKRRRPTFLPDSLGRGSSPQNATAASLLAKWTRLNKVVSAAPLIGPMPQMPVNRP